MSTVQTWSATAGLNNSSPPDGWPEGMARSAVNDCAREMMSALAKWYKDTNGTLVTATSTTAYTLATNSVYTSLANIPLLVFRAHAANTGTTTLNVDGLGAKPWRKDASEANYISGDIALGQLLVVGYNSVADDFFTVGPAVRPSVPAGTGMVFVQASVPTGWTAVGLDDRALRIVSSGTTGGGTGGTTQFSQIFTSRTITQAHLPSVNWNVTDTRTYTIRKSNGPTYTTSGALTPTSSADDVLSMSTPTGGSLTVASGGSGTGFNFAVSYVDACIGTKN